MRTSPKLALAVLLSLVWLPRSGVAQSDAKQRQAAAEAYDRGTAAYLSAEYEKAAEWFETANRMSPAAPALLQAARSHQKAGNEPRAATLALRLTLEYPDDGQATPFAQQLLDDLAAKYMRVDVVCEGCRLDLDGTLQEFHSFYLEPDTPHTLTASFETGDETTEIEGGAGESRVIEFEAPPAPAVRPPPTRPPPIEPGPADDPTAKPLPPLVTYIAGGVTAALLVGSIASSVDTQSGVDDYKAAAEEWRAAEMESDPAADELLAEAREKLEDGQSKETRTNVLWVATALAGAATAGIALFLTNWGDKETTDRVSLSVTPLPGGVHAGLEGRL